MPEVVLNANVIVGYLDAGDSLHKDATQLIERPESRGSGVVLLDFLRF